MFYTPKVCRSRALNAVVKSHVPKSAGAMKMGVQT